MNEVERSVVIGDDVENITANSMLSSQGGTRMHDLESAIPKFKVVDYECFKAEYDVSGRDIVVHFFLPSRKVTENYWKVIFAEALNTVGQEHFDATAPRLVAKYTAELHSWWFKAQGYDHVIDMDSFVGSFFAKLDSHMSPSLLAQS